MASMDHPYIVRLYAMCMGENLMLVTQFLPISLLNFLRKYKDDLNAYHLLTYGQQIAEVSYVYIVCMMSVCTMYVCMLHACMFICACILLACYLFACYLFV